VTLEQLIAAALVDELAPRLAAEIVGRRASGEDVTLADAWRLLTLDETADRLGRSPRWVRQRKEQIGYVRLDGGALAFRLEDLQAFAAERIVGGRALADRSEGAGGGRSLHAVP
jgi:hypothetical protein